MFTLILHTGDLCLSLVILRGWHTLIGLLESVWTDRCIVCLLNFKLASFNVCCLVLREDFSLELLVIETSLAPFHLGIGLGLVVNVVIGLVIKFSVRFEVSILANVVASAVILAHIANDVVVAQREK
jgi:hypothetical protein